MFSKEQQIKNIVSRETGVYYHALTPETHLLRLGLDSLEFLALLQTLQDEFNITFPDTVIAQLNTFGDLCAYIQNGKLERVPVEP